MISTITRFLLILFFLTQKVQSHKDSIVQFTEALYEVIQDPSMMENHKIYFVTSVNEHYQIIFNEILNGLFKKLDSSTTYQYQDVDHMVRGGRKYRRSNVILIGSCEDFDVFTEFLDKNYFNIEGYYIIAVYDRCDIDDIRQIFTIMWSHRMVNVNIVNRNNRYQNYEIEMFTYFPYVPLVCGEVVPRIIGKFNNSSFSSPPPYFVKKLENFHQCPINVAVFDFPPAMFVKNISGDIQLEGMDSELLNVFAKYLNFTINPIYSKERWGYMYENGTVVGASSLVVSGEADFIIGKTGLSAARNKYMRPSIPYFSNKLIMAVPIGKPFTAAEKLLMPFKIFVWIFVVMVLLIGLITIFLLRKASQSTQKFIMGSRTTTPIFNLVNLFLGGSLSSIQIPGRNFARTLVCIFILYGLVIRSAYTGALFRFIQSDSTRHNRINSIEELDQNDMKVYCLTTTMSFVQMVPYLNDRHVIVSSEERALLFERMSIDPTFDGVVVTSVESVEYYNVKNSEKLINFEPLHYADENLFSLNYVIYYNKNTHLKTTIDMAISDTAASGIYIAARRKYFDEDKLKDVLKDKSDEERKPLNLDQLSGCFEVLIVGTIASLLVFLIEIFSPFASKIVKKLQKK